MSRTVRGRNRGPVMLGERGMSNARTTPVELIAESAAQFAEEEKALLLVRLRAATFLLSAGLALILVRDLMFGRAPIWPFQAAATIAMMFLATLLLVARSGSERGLRVAEAAAFGLAAGVVAVHLWDAQVSGSAHGDATSMAAGSKDAVIGTTIVLFTYALFIPAPHGRAWRSIAAIAACPVATEALLFLTHPEVFRLARRVETAQRVGETVSLLVTAALLAGYGAHLVRTMRVRAREARQFHQYRLREELGAGGMGEVYLAEHRLLKRPCALKLIRPERASDPGSLAQFEREVRATALLSDPNTLDVYDYGQTADGTCFYVMEYLDGLTLDDLVARHGPMPPSRVIFFLRQVCEALAEAHAAGLIHRDLKPANLFAARRGRRYDFLKVLDFGLVEVVAARHEVGPSRERTVRGTPEYMAPEQITVDRAVDRRCDLYALGGVAYTLLTGRPPFVGETSTQVMNAHVRDPVVPPSRHRPDIPPDLEEIVLRCLAKDPDGRFQSAEELAIVLSACASADGWDAQKAAGWWEEFEPPGAAPRPVR
jgi:eukaryotic-like serine/threonine-protein kinase